MNTTFQVKQIGFTEFAAVRTITDASGVTQIEESIGIASTEEGAQALINEYFGD